MEKLIGPPFRPPPNGFPIEKSAISRTVPTTVSGMQSSVLFVFSFTTLGRAGGKLWRTIRVRRYTIEHPERNEEVIRSVCGG
jgi:hypothetical protein